MTRSPIFLLLFAVVLTVPALAQQQAAAEPVWLPLWKKARESEKRGAYLEAKGIYESLLKEGNLGREEARVRRDYEELEVKLLFSPIETRDSFYHVVAPGDTLYDLANQYGTTVELLRKSNQIASADRIYPGMKLKVTRKKFSIVVEKKKNLLTLLTDGKPFKGYRVATGEKGSTPVGTFKIVNKLEDPTWFHEGTVIPPESPDNLLGSRWLGFDLPGYGIHGTTLPRTIGTQASQGCIRMLSSDAEEVYSLVPVGTSAVVVE